MYLQRNTAIKQVTGHKSDVVALRYIDKSTNMKQGGASGGENKACAQRRRTVAERTAKRRRRTAAE